MGSFRRTLDSLNALVRSCVDCDRYPASEQGAGDVVPDCSKTYVSLLSARRMGRAGDCSVYNLEVQIALVYLCADEGAQLCVIDDSEAVICCVDATCAVGVDQVVCHCGHVDSATYSRPQGGAHVVKIRATLEGVICCGD